MYENFLDPISSYRGIKVSRKNTVFNAELQHFANQVSYIAAMETNGKITAKEAFSAIKALYKQLKLVKP